MDGRLGKILEWEKNGVIKGERVRGRKGQSLCLQKGSGLRGVLGVLKQWTEFCHVM